MSTKDLSSIQRWLIIVLLIGFIILSLLFISPKVIQARSDYHSSQLKMLTTVNGNVERTDYVDTNGKKTIAADLGYATIIVTKTDNCRFEEYYDDKGEPISRSQGYYKVLREYDDKGNAVNITYLDIESKPVVTLNGYANEKWEYNASGKVKEVRYYDENGSPIFTDNYGFGKTFEYVENEKACRITYIDDSRKPIMTKQGYSMVYQKYYETDGEKTGKIESEFYYDQLGRPISLLLGQYGVHNEYDDYSRRIVITYLNAEGNPTITNKGYTTVRRTFQADNSVATERYFDIDGNPCSLSDGQYGIKRQNGQTIYLNEKGDYRFSLKNLLYNKSWLIIFFAIMAIFASTIMNRRLNCFFLIAYLWVIVYLSLLFRESGTVKVNFRLFSTLQDISINSDKLVSIIENIWFFVPLGAILYRLIPHGKVFLVTILLISVLIEAIQYITKTGFCEMDDIVFNGIGGVLGYETCKIVCGLKNRYINKS